MGVDTSPRTAAQARDVIAELRASRRSAVIVGGGTLLHVAEPGHADAELSTLALGAVPYYEPADLIVSCEAGVTLAALNDRLSREGQVLPVWHPAPERATVAGLAAFGWTGLGRQLYGRLRDRVLEVRVVTGEGKLVRGGAKVVKNVTGFDLPRLFVGSMGTLGVIVELALKVLPKPPALFMRRLAGPREAGEVLRGAPMPVEAIVERGPGGWEGWVFAPGPEPDARALLGEVDGPGDADFVRLAGDPVLRGAGPEVSFRAAVPSSRAAELCEQVRGCSRAVVDLASGVVWAAQEERVGELRDFCEGAGGSLVLTGGFERAGMSVWGAPPRSIELMRRVKEQFDPGGVLGAGRFVV